MHPGGDHVRVLYVFLDIAEYLSQTIFLKDKCFFYYDALLQPSRLSNRMPSITTNHCAPLFQCKHSNERHFNYVVDLAIQAIM